MEPIVLTTETGSSKRLDAFLAESVEELTRAAAARLIESGMVLVNGKPASKSCKLTGAETVTVTLPEPEPIDAVPQNIPLDVVYEDDDVIVVNKPSGLVVHPAPGHPDGTLVNALLYHCGDSLSGVGGALRPGIVHRIDRDTSGLLIVAKTDRAHLGLAEQIAAHSFSREYEAVACGRFREPEGTVHAPIGRDPKNRQKMCVITQNSKDAVTHYRVLTQFDRHAHIRCRLETGRTHQIRVHMRHIGHPIYGDAVYGKAEKGIEGQCLHAKTIGFLHPATGEWMSFDSELPRYFADVLRRLS